jgi:opacity protein-like surface antigen
MRTAASTLVVVGAFLVTPKVTLAQAWTPAKGQGFVGLTYEFVEYRGHYDSNGKVDPTYSTRTQSASLEVEYGLTDRLAVDFRVPYIASKYTDRTPPNTPEDLRALFNEAVERAQPNPVPRFLDDGTYNATFQDFRAGVRYKLHQESFVLTPFVSFVRPSHHYSSIGESSPGRDLREFQVGVNFARRLDPILPQAYIHARYAYSFVETFLDASTDHSDAQVTLGYFISPPTLSVRAIGSWGQVHGGFAYEDTILDPERNLQHEKLLKAQYWHVGGGVSYSLSPSIIFDVGLVSFLAGKGTHYGTGLSFGVTRSFSTKETK